MLVEQEVIEARHIYTNGKNGPCIVCGEIKYSENLKFTLNSDEKSYSVSKGSCTDTEIFIPPIYNSLPVASISNSAFSGCSGLTSITIPDSVTSIGKSAFYKSGLTSAIIGKNVTSIGDDAFELKRVYYKGNATQWYRISTGIYNGFGTQYFYSETAPALNRSGLAYDGNYWHYDTDGKTPVIWIKEN